MLASKKKKIRQQTKTLQKYAWADRLIITFNCVMHRKEYRFQMVVTSPIDAAKRHIPGGG